MSWRFKEGPYLMLFYTPSCFPKFPQQTPCPYMPLYRNYCRCKRDKRHYCTLMHPYLVPKLCIKKRQNFLFTLEFNTAFVKSGHAMTLCFFTYKSIEEHFTSIVGSTIQKEIGSTIANPAN